MKYPWKRGEFGPKSREKWGAYESEAEEFAFARDGFPPNQRSLRILTSGLIGLYIRAVSLRAPRAGASPVVIDPERKREVVMLKELTWHFVILNPSLGAQQHGHKKISRAYSAFFEGDLKSGRFNAFPLSARESLQAATSDAERVRAVIDLIAGMAEQQAIQMYQRLAGISLGSIL